MIEIEKPYSVKKEGYKGLKSDLAKSTEMLTEVRDKLEA
jgi:hypothetical protein